MSEYKFPYIPKQYYPAVMFACKMLCETGDFNKSVKTAAKYYGVDVAKLKKYVRAKIEEFSAREEAVYKCREWERSR